MTPPAHWLPSLTPDGWLLFATYRVRLAAYGCVSVILGVYLAALGFEAGAIGLVFTAAVGGGGLMTATLSWVADRWGRRRVLVIGAVLMAGAGVVFATTTNLIVLLVAAVFGTLSPSGSEVVRSCPLSRPCCLRRPAMSTGPGRSPRTTWSARPLAQSAQAPRPSQHCSEPSTLLATALMWAYAGTGLVLAVLLPVCPIRSRPRHARTAASAGSPSDLRAAPF